MDILIYLYFSKNKLHLINSIKMNLPSVIIEYCPL